MLDMRAVNLGLASELCLLLVRNPMLCVTFGVADISLFVSVVRLCDVSTGIQRLRTQTAARRELTTQAA